MTENKERYLFYAGTALLIVAAIEVTLLPFIINMNFPALYIPLGRHRTVIGCVLFFALFFYLFSLKHFKAQVLVIALFFGYYYLFKFLVEAV